jgi:hypothetical protein
VGLNAFDASGSPNVIPAKGGAEISDRMRSARATVMAYSPWRALQGGDPATFEFSTPQQKFLAQFNAIETACKYFNTEKGSPTINPAAKR